MYIAYVGIKRGIYSLIPMSMLGHSLASYMLGSHPHAIALMTKLRCRQQPRELAGYPRNVLTVQLEHLDRHLVILIVIAIDTAGQTLAVVPPPKLLVNTVSQYFTGVYQLQFSIRLTKPDLSQGYIRISIEKNKRIIIIQSSVKSYVSKW